MLLALLFQVLLTKFTSLPPLFENKLWSLLLQVSFSYCVSSLYFWICPSIACNFSLLMKTWDYILNFSLYLWSLQDLMNCVRFSSSLVCMTICICLCTTWTGNFSDYKFLFGSLGSLLRNLHRVFQIILSVLLDLSEDTWSFKNRQPQTYTDVVQG